MSDSDFSLALVWMKNGARITRRGWNAPGQYVVHQPGYPTGIPINANTAKATGIPQGTVCRFRPYLMLRTADGSFVPWQPSVSDVLADDWTAVDLHGTDDPGYSAPDEPEIYALSLQVEPGEYLAVLAAAERAGMDVVSFLRDAALNAASVAEVAP